MQSSNEDCLVWICHILQVTVREHPFIYPVERWRGGEVEGRRGWRGDRWRGGEVEGGRGERRRGRGEKGGERWRGVERWRGRGGEVQR